MATCHHGLESPTCAACKYGPAPSDTYNGPPPDIDYAWNARKHEVTSRRNAKGAMVRKVTRFGAATVIGALDRDVNGNPLLAELGPDTNLLAPSSAAARLLVRAELRRRRLGYSTLDVDAITRAAFPPEILPPVVGSTDVRQYEQVIHRSRSESSDVTAHAVGLDGGQTHELSTMWISGYVDAYGARTARVVRDDTIGDIFAPNVAYAPQTATIAAWPTRGTYGVTVNGRLPLAERASDPTTDRVFRVASDGTCERVVRVVTATADTIGLPTTVAEPIPTVAPRLVTRYTRQGPRFVGTSGVDVHGKSYTRTQRLAPGVASVTRLDGSPVLNYRDASAEPVAVERVFIGHDARDRTPAIVKTTEALKARTVEADRPTTREGWVKLLASLAPGKRLDYGDLTVTYGKSGAEYSALPRGGARIRSRSAEGLAAKLATV